jgi:C-terminal processing protease CtpA/Prc
VLGAVVLCGTLSCRTDDRAHPQEVENLRAFAKLYGYVRFFHPSDQASRIDWDRFAVLGASRVCAVSERDQLRQTLEELFCPIAPAVQIYDSAGDPPEPVDLVPLDTSGLEVVAWQHRGVDLGPRTPYVSIRTNRAIAAPAPGPGFGTVTRGVDAAELRGREIRMRAAVKAEVDGPNGRGQLWLRVDRADRQRGFFDSMQDRPVTSPEWATYEILGEVADDAERVYFGCFLSGVGKVWVDEITLWTRDPGGDWETLEISNPGFESGDEAVGWSTASPGYEYEVDAGEAYRENRSLRIQELRKPQPASLFEKVPEVGEAVIKDLGGGLAARVPLALFSDANGTLGGQAPPLDPLLTELDALDIEQMDSSDLGLRLGGVVIAWNVFQHFYPYFDLVSADWDVVLTESLIDALDDADRKEYLNTLRRMVARLEDGHGRVFHPAETQDRAFPPFTVDWIEDRVVVTRVSAAGAVQPGGIVLALDGRPVNEVVEEMERLISGSPQWKRARCMSEFGVGDNTSEIRLTVDRLGESFEVSLVRDLERPSLNRQGPTIEELDDGVLYVDLTRAQMADIFPRIDAMASAPGIVVDLRGYPRGTHPVLTHLTDEPLQSAHWMVPQIVYPDRENLVGYDRSGRWKMEPRQPIFTGGIVFLINGRAISYAESFMGIVEAYRPGEIVGKPTAGTNGNVNPFTLPGGFRVTWTGMRVEKHDGSQHQLIGILPTVPVARTIEGVREGRDELLERALEIIRQGP